MNKSDTSPPSFPLAYFITFTCYGTWLHGAKEKSVDRLNNQPLSPYIKPNAKKAQGAKSRMLEPPLILCEEQRLIVLMSIKEVCRHRNWELIATQVRTNHVHIIASASATPEKIMQDVKAYASRKLNKIANPKRLKYWTRHGSTRYLWNSENLYLAIRYVILQQGKQTAIYKNKNYSLDTSEWT